jgi:hypothetical protein
MKIKSRWGVKLGAMIALSVVVTAAGCTSQTGNPGAVDDNGNTQAMLAAWRTGTCPQSDSGWAWFLNSVNVPNTTPAPVGQRVALVPSGVDRFVLCRFSTGSRTLTGAAVVSKSASVMRLTDDLDDVISRDTTACIGTQLVMILAGYGQSVTTIDVSIDGCSEIYGSQLAEYQGTALAQDLDAALTAA